MPREVFGSTVLVQHRWVTWKTIPFPPKNEAGLKDQRGQASSVIQSAGLYCHTLRASGY